MQLDGKKIIMTRSTQEVSFVPVVQLAHNNCHPLLVMTTIVSQEVQDVQTIQHSTQLMSSGMDSSAELWKQTVALFLASHGSTKLLVHHQMTTWR